MSKNTKFYIREVVRDTNGAVEIERDIETNIQPRRCYNAKGTDGPDEIYLGYAIEILACYETGAFTVIYELETETISKLLQSEDSEWRVVDPH